MPVSGARCCSSWVKASSLPADAPTPTMGKPLDLMASTSGAEVSVRRARFASGGGWALASLAWLTPSGSACFFRAAARVIDPDFLRIGTIPVLAFGYFISAIFAHFTFPHRKGKTFYDNSQ